MGRYYVAIDTLIINFLSQFVCQLTEAPRPMLSPPTIANVMTTPRLGYPFSRPRIIRLKAPLKMPSMCRSPTPPGAVPGFTKTSIVASSGFRASRRPGSSIGALTDPRTFEPVAGHLYEAEPSARLSG
jgi:hypothetical protein